jgi:hypothetical protein
MEGIMLDFDPGFGPNSLGYPDCHRIKLSNYRTPEDPVTGRDCAALHPASPMLAMFLSATTNPEDALVSH